MLVTGLNVWVEIGERIQFGELVDFSTELVLDVAYAGRLLDWVEWWLNCYAQ